MNLVVVPYHIARQSPCKSQILPLRGIYSSSDDLYVILMPPSQAALRTALVTAMAFAHHKAQEKTALAAWAELPG
jgi:hypothetical protein